MKRMWAAIAALILTIEAFAVPGTAAINTTEGGKVHLRAHTTQQSGHQSYSYDQNSSLSYNPYAGNYDVWNSLSKLQNGYFKEKIYDTDIIYDTDKKLEFIEITKYKLTTSDVLQLVTVNGENAGDLLVNNTPSISNQNDWKYVLHQDFADSTAGNVFIDENTEVNGSREELDDSAAVLIEAILDKFGISIKLEDLIQALLRDNPAQTITIGQGEDFYYDWAKEQGIDTTVYDINNIHSDFPFTYGRPSRTYLLKKPIYTLTPVTVRKDLITGGVNDFEVSNDRYKYIEKLIESFESAGIEHVDVALITDYKVTEASLGKVIGSVPQNHFKWTIVNRDDPTDIKVEYSATPDYSFIFPRAGEYHIECENLVKNTVADVAKVQYVAYSVITDTNNVIDIGHTLAESSAITVKTNERTQDVYVLHPENKWDITVTPNMVGKKFTCSSTSSTVTDAYNTERIE